MFLAAQNHHRHLIRTFSQNSARSCGARYLSSGRTELEEEHHLARALSRFDIDPTEQRRWKKLVKRRSWDMMHFGADLHIPPSYEARALEQIHKKSFSTNVLLEIRDVRVPASSHHPSFTRLAKHRLHLVCYTHADMIDAPTRDRVERWTQKSFPDSKSIFIDSREHRSIDTDRPYDFVYDGLMENLEQAGGLNAALTVGVANTGKSSVLMALLRTARERGDRGRTIKVAQPKSRKEPTKRGKVVKSPPPGILDTPGKTREITEYILRDKPRVYFLDVPGVTPPRFMFDERPEAWFALSAANLLALPSRLLDDVNCQTALCDYVLYCMNRDSNFGYVKRCGLEQPTDDILEVLPAVKRGHGLNLNDRALRMGQCRAFLKLFNSGNFGPVILDDLSQPYEKFVFTDAHFKDRSNNNKQQQRSPPRDRQNSAGRNRRKGDAKDDATSKKVVEGEGAEFFRDDDFEFK